MPLLQRIELSNFLNSTRAKPWRPDWPHQVFEIGGVNAALNIPNGKGKSTMVTAILAMLAGHGKSLKDIRNRFFAPPSAGHYTHIRIEVRVPMPGSGEDLFACAGGEPGGLPMVFGMYGYSGDNEHMEFYAYQGTFEDCPVAHVHQLHHTLVADDAFLGQLKSCSNLFPSNAKERTKRAWQAYVEDFFDMSSIKQQLIYQLMRGAEGGSTYFEVKEPRGMSYAAGVFYERLAPALLTDLMGELGEEGEHGIEDTIYVKVTKLIAARRETELKAEELRRAENTLRELESLVVAGENVERARQAYDQHREAFSLELAVLKDVVVDNPIPGVPRTPPDSAPALVRSMVLQGGTWFLPDRVMAEFTGEPASDVNRRAQERKGLELTQANRTQVIEFACHSFTVLGKRGPSGSLYSRESALALLNHTSNFTRDWTREKAVEAVTGGFDWVEGHADTNPARLLKKQKDAEWGGKTQERDTLRMKYQEYQGERERLIEEQSQVGAQQAEYRRMVESKLFADKELAEPAATGLAVGGELQAATRDLESHQTKVVRLTEVYQSWQDYLREHEDSVSPAERADKLKDALGQARTKQTEISGQLAKARGLRKGLGDAKALAEKGFNNLTAKLQRFLETQPAMAQFAKMFGRESPVGLAKKVRQDLEDAQDRITAIEKERDRYKPSLDGLALFRQAHGEAEPEGWIKARQTEWDSIGGTISRLEEDLNEAKIRRSALDEAVIVAGKVTREAADIAGGNQVPLHVVVERMRLDTARRERVLTVFSALLHAPVYDTVGEATDAAGRLDKAGIEAPVFLRPDLEEFCRTGEISWIAASAHTWLVGIRTRQVDCLLDPSLVEREKEEADKRIQALTEEIGVKVKERMEYDPEHPDTATARLAADALKHGYPATDVQLAEELRALNKRLPDLESKASTETLQIIHQAERHQKEFAAASEESIKTELAAAAQESARASEAFSANETAIEELENALTDQQEIVDEAMQAATKIPSLLGIQAFIDHPEDNPAFMESAEGKERTLSEAKEQADKRTRFQFDLAEFFIKRAPDRPKQIEARLTVIRDEMNHIQDTLLPALDAAIKALEERRLLLITEIGEIDNFVRDLIKKYRNFAAEKEEEVAIARERIEYHPLGGFAIGLREESDTESLIRMLRDINDDIRGEEASEFRQAMTKARGGYQSAKSSLEALVDRILVMPDLDMTEHVRIELERAKETPSITLHLRNVARSNFEKNQAANKTAAQHLEIEWANIGKWLKAFTQRLPDNLKTMVDTFGPARDKDTKAYLSAGFEIEATLAKQDDIKAVLEDVVKKVETAETAQRALENAAPSLRDEAMRGTRAEIRKTFYEKVILNPVIRVYMPSISQHPLKLERGMVSTGQGVAMTLLWIVKMADYITQREMRRMTTDRVQQKHLHPTQFALMDGAFSSLSNKGLIKDALDSIKSTRGRFQLIITGHDENYQNNFDYFPTLIEAREINGQFMYAESKSRRILQPEEVGSHYGAMGVMNVRVRPQNAQATGQP